MKKNVICGVVVVIALAAMLFFVLSGDNTTEPETVDVTGTWRVVTYVNNDSVTFIDNEFMVFDSGRADDYRDGNESPYVSSSYSIDSSMGIQLPDISREYKVDKKSENYMRLYESPEVYMSLIRYTNGDMTDVEVDTSVVTGKWDVVCHAGHTGSDEYLVFDNGTMHNYRGTDSTPVATMDYSWNENEIVIPDISKTMILYILSETEIAFVETDTGFVWILKVSE